MANSIDTLINNAESRAAFYAGEVYWASQQLSQFLADKDTGLYLPGKTNADGTVDTGLNLTGIDLPTYTTPTADTTPTPVYEPPTSALPTAPELSGIGSITLPTERTEPSIDTSGLFAQVAPSANLPDFNEAEPDLNIDWLVAEMDAIAAPVIRSFDMPVLSALSLSDRPALDLPAFDPLVAPDTLDTPEDYAAYMEAKYQQMAPEMQAFIDDKIATWVATYAPEYVEWNSALQAKVTDGMASTVLPDEIESAMFTRARDRASAEFDAAIYTDSDNFAKSGLMQPPGLLVSREHDSRMKKAAALANQATDVYIERRKMEVQHLQFVMNLASSQIASVRSLAIGYAGVVGNTLQQAVSYSVAITDKLEKIYDHLIARSGLIIQVMGALNAQYETRLKAALSALDGYRLELDAEKLKKDVELAQLQFIETQIKAQELEIQRYSALIDAVSKKSSMEELKLKGYEIRSDVFKTRTQATVAAFDVYKASIDGDKSKLEGELAQLEIYNSLLKSDELKLDAQMKAIQATEANNNAKAKLFEIEGDVWKLDAQAAIQKFSAYAEVKKLTQSIYGQELTNAIESFKANLEIPKILMEAMIKEYELRMQTAIEEAKIDVSKLAIQERAAEGLMSGYQSMGSSALGSLNTMASSAISATA